MIATHLADASVWAELHRNDVAARLVSLLVGGGAATCGIVDLEVLRSFEEGSARADAAAERAAFPRVPVDDAILDRALEVQELLDQPVPTVALVVAAAAERAGLVLLHHDDVYERIASVTGQPTERIAP